MRITWADTFPLMEPYYATNDPRIFHTKFVPESNAKKANKIRTYFCYVINGNGYKVDVIREWAKHTEKECEEAYFKVKAAADYFESNGQWPDIS